jgi:long-subunit acyl-CoA synthetase (AMP-forming)
MKTKVVCAYGHKLPKDAQPTEDAEDFGCAACSYIRKNQVVRCSKFVCVAGQTPDGEKVDQWRCSDSWVPVLLVENAMTNRGQTAAIESMRNETIKRHDVFNNIMLKAAENRRIGG